MVEQFPEKQEIFAARVLRNTDFKSSRGYNIHQRFWCFPEMVTSGHPRGCRFLPVPHSCQGEDVCPGGLCIWSFRASGKGEAASPGVAVLLHREALTLPHSACSCGHRDCTAPFPARGFNRGAMAQAAAGNKANPGSGCHTGRNRVNASSSMPAGIYITSFCFKPAF